MSTEAHADHRKIYLMVLIALAVGTLVTVLISKVDLGRPLNIAIGLLVATVKASLVVLFFMHLKYEQRWWAGIVLFPLLLVMIIIFSNFADTALNEDHLSPAVPAIEHRGKPGAAH